MLTSGAKRKVSNRLKASGMSMAWPKYKHAMTSTPVARPINVERDDDNSPETGANGIYVCFPSTSTIAVEQQILCQNFWVLRSREKRPLRIRHFGRVNF